MKIIAYSVRKDELQYFEKFAEQFGIEYATTSKDLNAETVKLAEGFDAVSSYTSSEELNDVWEPLSKMGISYFTVRTAGYDGIDIEKAKSFGIKISNVPQYSPSAIAEFAVALALATIRNIPLCLSRAKNQNFSVDNLMGRELNTMTIGIIGTGHIGLTTAKVFKAFGAKIIAYDTFENPQAQNILEYKSLDEVFAESDLISLHVPLTPQNHHIINAESIAKMKDGVVIVNTARGGHINTADLRDALVSGKVAAAGLDVFENEKQDSVYRDLSNFPNVIITPHVAFNTDIAVQNMVKMSTENLISFKNAGTTDNEITK